MGEKLDVKPGADLVVAIAVRDPSGRNYSPYTFANPSLAQIGIEQPLNKPVLDHIDVIGGAVTGYKQPGAADYSGQWPNTWITNPDLATVPAGAKNTSAQRAAHVQLAHLEAYGDTAVQDHGLPPSRRGRARSTCVCAAPTCRPRCRSKPMPTAIRWRICGPTPRAINPTLPGGADGVPANANLRIPCTTVGTNVPDNGVTYTGTTIDGCPAHLPVVNGQKMVGLRRGGVGGPVVLQQSGLHRSEGLVAGGRRQVVL